MKNRVSKTDWSMPSYYRAVKNPDVKHKPPLSAEQLLGRAGVICFLLMGLVTGAVTGENKQHEELIVQLETEIKELKQENLRLQDKTEMCRIVQNHSILQPPCVNEGTCHEPITSH